MSKTHSTLAYQNLGAIFLGLPLSFSDFSRECHAHSSQSIPLGFEVSELASLHEGRQTMSHKEETRQREKIVVKGVFMPRRVDF